MSWSEKYKRSINCDNPKGFSQRAHCQGRKKKLKEQFKPFKTVEQIAKKHRLDVSFIQKQLDMGEPIEHEHTKDHKLAKEIALQHLDEIPDYYTRLKKMEASAKKEHKKFKDFKEHCGCEDDAVSELESALKKLDDTSYDSIDKLMRRIMKKHDMTAKQLHNAFVDKNKKTPDDWVQNLGEATDGIKAKDYKGRLDRWFDDGGWVQTGGKYDGKPCAKQPGQTTKPYCRDPDDRASMDKKERNKRAAKKRREDPNPNRSGRAKMVTQEAAGEKDACYKKVKSRYKVWPSAYASGALVKCRRVGADSWGTKTEETEMQRYCPRCQKNESRNDCKYGPKYWDMFSTPITLSSNAYDPNSPHPANEERDHEYSMARSEISTIISAAKRLKKKMGKGEGGLEAWVQSKITKAADYLDSAADYVDSGEMKAESIERGPILPKEKGKRVFPKGSEPKATGAKLPNINKESVSIEDANGNHYVEFIDIIKPEPLKASDGIGSRMLDEAGKKCWPGYKKKGTQKLFGKTYNRCVKEGKTFDQFMESIDKSKMKCNSPKSDPVGDSLTGKSHVVKACSGGQEKIIRFGQRGVKGSPKKKGESKEYASRRHRFQTRHAKNIAKGPMSAAYWANKVKW